MLPGTSPETRAMPQTLSTLRINFANRCVIHSDRVVTIEPKAALLLALLQKFVGQVVTPETIRAQVWGGRALGKGVLSQTVHKLRTALGDDGTLIRSLRHQGYVLTSALVEDLSSAPLPQHSAGDAGRIGSGAEAEKSAISMQSLAEAARKKSRADVEFAQLGKTRLAHFPTAVWIVAVLLGGSGLSYFYGADRSGELSNKPAVQVSKQQAQSAYELGMTYTQLGSRAGFREAESLFESALTNPAYRTRALSGIATLSVQRYFLDRQDYSVSLERARGALVQIAHADQALPIVLLAHAEVASLSANPWRSIRYLQRGIAKVTPAVEASFALHDQAGAALATHIVAAESGADVGARLHNKLAREALVPGAFRIAQFASERLPQSEATRALVTAQLAHWQLNDVRGLLALRTRFPADASALWAYAAALSQAQQIDSATAALNEWLVLNPDDDFALAIALTLAAKRGSLTEAQVLFEHYRALPRRGDGASLCMVFEALDALALREPQVELLGRINEVPQDAVEGLWLRAYAANLASPSGAFADTIDFASAAFERDVVRGTLVKFWRPDFSFARLTRYHSWLKSAAPSPAVTQRLARLHQAIASERIRLANEGLNPRWLARLELK